MSDDQQKPQPTRREFLLESRMTPDDFATFKSLMTTSLNQNRELSDDDRKAAVITTVDTVFGTKYPWLSEALSFLFDLLVEVQDGKFSIKADVAKKAKSFCCCS